MERLTFFELLAPSGQEALAAAEALNPREVDFLTHFQKLRRQYPDHLARASLEVAILRGEGAKKFPQARQMYFTRDALEQASSYPVSRYRAERFKGFERIFDLGCSVGGDTLSLAAVAPTIGIDLDPLRLAMARENLRTLHLEAGFLLADMNFALPIASLSSPNTAFFFDPSRRKNNRRVFSVNAYTPPLWRIKDWLEAYSAFGVKISPGVKLPEIQVYPAEIEFISLKGELKEAVLWFGPLKTTARRATILPGNHTMVGKGTRTLPERLSHPLGYLYDPDPAVLRAGLVRNLAREIDGYQLDPDIAYLTATQAERTPFARFWEIEDWFPFGLKRLRSYLRERGVGKVVVKKRGSPLQPDALIRDLRLKGAFKRVVFLTHLSGRPIVVVCYSNDII